MSRRISKRAYHCSTSNLFTQTPVKSQDGCDDCDRSKKMEIELSFSTDNPPLSVTVAAKITGISLSPDSSLPSGSSPNFCFSSGLKLHGTNVLLRHLGQIATIPDFYRQDALESSQIDEWLEYPVFLSGSEFENACSHVDGYLLLQTFLVGHSLSIADIAFWSGLAGSIKKSQSHGVEWDKLWTINKKIIDPGVLLTLIDELEKPFVRIIPRHKKSYNIHKENMDKTMPLWYLSP